MNSKDRFLLDRCRAIIKSCTTSDQLDCASKFSYLAAKKITRNCMLPHHEALILIKRRIQPFIDIKKVEVAALPQHIDSQP